MIESKKSTKTDVFGALEGISGKMPQGHADQILADLKKRLK